MERRTEGELVFERYLRSRGLPFEFEKEHLGKIKRPDYALEWEGESILLDVKDFDPPKTVLTGFQAFDPYSRIREKIDQGRQKFSQFKEQCCGLVLYNTGDPFVQLCEDYVMLGSMYGDSGFTFPMNTGAGVGDAGSLKPAFIGRGKMTRLGRNRPQNTTISALITLERIRPHFSKLLDMVHEFPHMSFEEVQDRAAQDIRNYDPDWEVQRVIVWHNGVARIPFPESLFRGSYDTHIGIVWEDGNRFQRLTSRGDLLPERLWI